MKHDFYRIVSIVTKKDMAVIYPEFLTQKCKDLMVKGGKFYAIIDKDTGFWRQDEYMVQKFIDEELYSYKEEMERHAKPGTAFMVRDLNGFKSRAWKEYREYINSRPDSFHQLDNKLCFANTQVEPKDYISKSLPYPLEPGSYDSWDEIVSTLYSPEEREKIEWAIGSIVSGDSVDIQKFVVLYGDPGAGKGTIIKIIQKLFPGYYEMFDAKSLSNNNNQFAFEQFRSNPLIALQTDGDLSRIEDNTKINSIVSHETIVMNEKKKQSYNFTPKCFLFMASNKPVKITDAKSGIIRRLIDVHPTGNTLPKKQYDKLMSQIDFELSGIAWHCLEVYKELGKNYYNGYRPLSMMYLTDSFFNFIEDNYDVFASEEGISLQDAYDMWNAYCNQTGMDNRLPRYKFREELKNYFDNFEDRTRINGAQVRSWYSGFKKDKLNPDKKGQKAIIHNDKTFGLVLDQKTSLLDDILKDCQAQYAVDDGHGGTKPSYSWDNCKTTLKDIDTKQTHFVRVPKNHIVIDFDLKNEKGEKDALLNLEAADKWPRTYAEYSQGGKGIHLHYIYDGDPDELERNYSKEIEIKVYSGKSSLRRRLSLCNNLAIAVLTCGLPKREVKDTIDFDSVKDEKHIRNIVAKCLKKDISQPYTTPAMSLIKKTLDDAYANGIKYDIRDLRPAINAFAAKSHNQKDTCMRMANELHYFSKHFDDDHKWDGSLNAKKDIEIADEVRSASPKNPHTYDETIVFFDIEVFPNLLLVNWKEAGENKPCVRMINPTRQEVSELLKKKLVGFNCRRYDNHILYARSLGYDNDQIYRLSQRIINGSNNCMFGNAYDISYTDVYDFAATKQSLKKWEIELDIHHQELGLPWDKPVPEERWAEVAEYCDNDVIATEVVFNHLAGDFKAREILADIAGMTVNDTTNMLTTRIIFGDDPKPQNQFNYPDLKKKFPGYFFVNGKSYYKHQVKAVSSDIPKLIEIYGEEHVHWNPTYSKIEVDELIGEGGRVYANPGIYHNVVTYDVASMHPSSIIAENGFGKYTERFKQLLDIRIAIKHKDFETAKKMLDGKLAKYLTNKDQAKALSQALKIAINSVYGLTAAGFDNKFRDPRNKDNWVAKRGALFMEELRLKVQSMGATVVHIKTDSIKIENPTQEVTDYILSRGKEYGYTFEVEDIYEKICLVNDAVYIALRDKQDPGWTDECEKAKKKAEEEKRPYSEPTRWTATGAQFQHPYVFKTLFSHEPLDFKDFCETKTVTSALYLDMNENLTDPTDYEKELEKLNKAIAKACNRNDWEENINNISLTPELSNALKRRIELLELISKCHNYMFIGKAGSFCPMKPGTGGGVLVREKDGKYYAATGSKGYRWREGESVKGANRLDLIDLRYFEALDKTAKEAIEVYGNFEDFTNETVIPKKQTSQFMTIDEVLEKSDRESSRDGKLPWEE